MNRIFRSNRPGRAEYAGLVLFVLAWGATIALTTLPRSAFVGTTAPVQASTLP
ncbi:hypothetical protein [Pseudogemmobacter blasticus]|uniref:hypothetical protein n=1 Tax=Fuscovulum blasticum TaxID=1075 RepID=UPI0015E7AD17|nr:hypothetical protein [Fuscovulum blasticum]